MGDPGVGQGRGAQQPAGPEEGRELERGAARCCLLESSCLVSGLLQCEELLAASGPGALAPV